MTRGARDLDLARAFLADVKGRARLESKKRNLDLLWRALEQTRDEGKKRYGIADVGAKLAVLGGMKAQSIRNEAGEDYRKLIQLFADADSSPALDASPLERALALIADDGVRQGVKAALVEARRLKVENDRLRALCGEIVIPLHAGMTPTAKAVAIPSAGLTPRLRSALQKGMSPERLAERGLSVNADGSINQGGQKLFPPGFASAIEQILVQGDSQPQDGNRLS